jgi:hypothetical protein
MGAEMTLFLIKKEFVKNTYIFLFGGQNNFIASLFMSTLLT